MKYFPMLQRPRPALFFCLFVYGTGHALCAVDQVRGTITETPPIAKAKDGAPYEVNASAERYSVRVLEPVVQPTLACYVVSNLHDVYTSGTPAESTDPHRSVAMTFFQTGNLPTQASWRRAQILAYACLAARLSVTGGEDVKFTADVVPQLVRAQAEMEVAFVQAHLVRHANGVLDRIDFWGSRSAATLKTFANTTDTFLLATLKLNKIAGMLPLSGEFTIYGKRLGVGGRLTSFERKKYQFSGETNAVEAADAFGSTYDRSKQAKSVVVYDQRFTATDGGNMRSYVLRTGDEIPFDPTRLPKWTSRPLLKPYSEQPPSPKADPILGGARP